MKIISNYLCEKPLIYISHAILGVSGDMEGNCKKAHKAAERLRKVFPEVNFFVPGENDWVLQILYSRKRLSVKDILDADFEILKQCNGWCFLKWEESSGSLKEKIIAVERNLVVPGAIVEDDASKMSFARIRKRFSKIVEYAVQNYKEKK